MSLYSIPALTMDSEFADLVFVGRYVDDLVKKTGDLDYSIVYEWDEHGPGGWPPVAVLARLDGRWWRRPVLVSARERRDGSVAFQMDLTEGDVNAH